ncbi:NAD(P)H-binding protein [Kribbella sp. NPDC026611]|uniref:NAD(P)H-binding protein n=1 Tax=Kribbella sp. NPDC026611 TaxID=3154911 RepID=UPI00340F1082
MVLAVTGGHGEFGAAVLTHLKTLTDEPVVATVRAPGEPRRGGQDEGGGVAGVEYRPGDFADPETLARSLEGVDSVLVNATFFGADPSRREPLVRAAIGAAVEAGVGRIVLTSWPQPAAMPTVQDYAALEEAVRESGPQWTNLRMSVGLADALARDVVWGRKSGELVAPAAGAVVTPAALRELAEASAAVLVQPDFAAEVLELSGPDAIGWDELAALAGVSFRAVTDDEFIAYVSGTFQLPDPVARQLAALYADFRGPWASTPTSTLAELLGRPATPGIDAVHQRVSRFPS